MLFATYHTGVTVPLPCSDFTVRFFFPVPVPFFFDRTTFIGSGVLLRVSSAVIYGGKEDVGMGDAVRLSGTGV